MREFDILCDGTKELFEEFFTKEGNKKQQANMWTFTRLVLPFLIVITSSKSFTSKDERNKKIYLAYSAILASFAAVTDYMDGKTARKYNATSEYGKLLDQVADKVFAFVLGLNLTNLDHRYLRIVIGEILIASVNLYYKRKDETIDMQSTTIGKIKEWPLFMTLASGYISSIDNRFDKVKDALINTTSIMQALTLHSYIKQNKELIKSK